ncbi:MAG: hypothetical protein ACJ75Z_14835 [Solirubrobacterales bacterium]
MREFRRSAIFGVVGVFVVAGIAIAIALSADPSNANPKLQYGLIFGVLGVFVVLLLLFQRRAMNRAAAGDVRGLSKGPQEVDDPTKLGDGELWAALAVKPIDRDAIKAREEMWRIARRSLKLGAVIFALIFIAVPPIYLFDTFTPLLIGAPLIVIAAIYGGIRAIGSGGDVDTGYDNMDRAMKPLGLSLMERPEVRMVPRGPTMPGYSAKLFGPTVMAGERHGHRVEVLQEQGKSEVTVHASVPDFHARAKDGRFLTRDGASNAAGVLRGVSASDRWKGVKVQGGAEGIVVDRKGDPSAWLCDLWLAERLAEQL